MARILLADDDAAVRDLVRRALTGDGHTVHVTQDGGEALDYFEQHAGEVDMIVTDVDMPNSVCDRRAAGQAADDGACERWGRFVGAGHGLRATNSIRPTYPKRPSPG